MWVGSATPDDERTYYELTPLPNFIEALSVIEDVSGVSLELVNRLWGGTIIGAWAKWELAIRLIRRRSGEPTSYENFEMFAKRLEDLRRAERAKDAGAEARYGLVIR